MNVTQKHMGYTTIFVVIFSDVIKTNYEFVFLMDVPPEDSLKCVHCSEVKTCLNYARRTDRRIKAIIFIFVKLRRIKAIIFTFVKLQSSWIP